MAIRLFVTSIASYARLVIAGRPSDGNIGQYLPAISNVTSTFSAFGIFPHFSFLISGMIDEMIASLTGGEFGWDVADWAGSAYCCMRMKCSG